MYTARFMFSLLSAIFALQVMAQDAPVDAAAYFSGEPFGWAVCSDASGKAYVLDGGNRSAAPKTIVLYSSGGDDYNAIFNAIKQYDIIL